MSKKLANQFVCSRMMLPEHRERLNEHRRKLQYEEEYCHPLLDEQLWEEFQLFLNQSAKYDINIEITVLGEKGYLKITGVVKNTDSVSGQITLDTKNGVKKIIAKQIVTIVMLKKGELT